MRFVAFLCVVAGVSAQTYTTVTFTNYNDGRCREANNSVTRPLGKCILEDRENHWRTLSCSSDGRTVADVEYSDQDCVHRVTDFNIEADKCHEGRGLSVRVACNTASEQDDELLSQWKLIEEQNRKMQREFEQRPKPVYANLTAPACIARATVVARAVDKARGEYCECVCPHLSPWRCDCSGLVSFCWELPAPGHVTQNLPGVSARLGGWGAMEAGDIILKPSQHVELFRSWEAHPTTFAYCGCHNTAEGCSCRTGTTTSYWQANGYYPAHGNNVC